MFVNSDFSDLLKLFNDNHVKYLFNSRMQPPSRFSRPAELALIG